jgi:hypothetical protein
MGIRNFDHEEEAEEKGYVITYNEHDLRHIFGLPQAEEDGLLTSYSNHYLRHLNRVNLSLLVSYELLRVKLNEYQWIVDHGAPVVSPSQIEIFQAEIERLTPLLDRLRQVL